MTEEQVVALMRSSNSAEEWRSNTNKVKEAYGGDYPEFWHAAMLLPPSNSVAMETYAKWGEKPSLVAIIT